MSDTTTADNLQPAHMTGKKPKENKKTSQSSIVGKLEKVQQPVGLIQELPKNYTQVLSDIKFRVRNTQAKTVVAVNRELIGVYLYIGEVIAHQKEKSNWGDKIVERLGCDLTKEFPNMKGFSRTNLFYMRQMYLAYKDSSKIVQQAVGQIPWGSNLLILSKISDQKEREWYLYQTSEHGWSRAVLWHQIDTDLYHRQKQKKISNFKLRLPPAQSELVEQTLKDPYIFDFLSVGDDAHEREIEKELVKHVTNFLLELGAGFSYVGRQYHLEVGNEDFYIDLLFYHLKLRSYVVVELKNGKFKPEYAGQLNFYLSAIDAQIKHPDDNPSIGLLLCKDKNKLVAEYALKDISKPVGISEYKIVKSIPKKLETNLPKIETLEKELLKDKEK